MGKNRRKRVLSRPLYVRLTPELDRKLRAFMAGDPELTRSRAVRQLLELALMGPAT
jgi:hypothetical protein